MALEGTLATVSFADVLQLLGSTQKTGILHVTRGSAWRRLYLRDGIVIAAASSAPDEFVGDTLAALGRVTEEDLRDALSRQQREGKLVGLILVEEGKLDAEELKRHLADRAYDIVGRLMSWEGAMFRFEEYTLLSQDLIPLDLSVEALLMEGFRRADELVRFRETIPSDDTILSLTGQGDALQFGAGSLAALIFDNLEVPRPLRLLRKRIKTTEFALLEALVGLIEKGLVQASERMEENGFRRLGVDDLWLEHARSLIAAGQHANAVVLLRRHLGEDPTNSRARTLLAEAEGMFLREMTRTELLLSSVPVPVTNLDDLLGRSLSPAEAFLLSRVDGETDIESLLEATPLSASETLITLKRLLDDSYIRLEQP